MYSLYIDTHSSVVVVLYQDNKIKIKKEIDSLKDTSTVIMPTIDSILKENSISVHDLKQIIVVNGPGSFTGVRLGVTIAKMLAFTLKIDIKVLSSLEVKAVSFNHDIVNIVEREKNGVFLGKFNKDNKLLDDYRYLKTSEYDLTNKDKTKENIKIDYEKVYNYAVTKESMNPHLVNPLYVKKIEVKHD